MIADKYNSPELKNFCVKFLIENISNDNVCSLVEFALKYEEAQLMKRAEDYFVENVTGILETEEWAQFVARNSVLATNLLKKNDSFSIN